MAKYENTPPFVYHLPAGVDKSIALTFLIFKLCRVGLTAHAQCFDACLANFLMSRFMESYFLIVTSQLEYRMIFAQHVLDIILDTMSKRHESHEERKGQKKESAPIS